VDERGQRHGGRHRSAELVLPLLRLHLPEGGIRRTNLQRIEVDEEWASEGFQERKKAE